MQYMEDIYQKLRSSGLRSTKQRIQISKILFKSNETFRFTILDLEKMIKKEFQEKISVATIYNTVHAFQKKGYLNQDYSPVDSNKNEMDFVDEYLKENVREVRVRNMASSHSDKFKVIYKKEKK